jgi:hypothetical protein
VERLEAAVPERATAPSTPAFLTRSDLRHELDALERRVQRDRVSDLQYVLRSLAASEVRTDTWIDHTQEAIALLALSQDPRVQAK